MCYRYRYLLLFLSFPDWMCVFYLLFIYLKTNSNLTLARQRTGFTPDHPNMTLTMGFKRTMLWIRLQNGHRIELVTLAANICWFQLPWKISILSQWDLTTDTKYIPFQIRDMHHCFMSDKTSLFHPLSSFDIE